MLLWINIADSDENLSCLKTVSTITKSGLLNLLTCKNHKLPKLMNLMTFKNYKFEKKQLHSMTLMTFNETNWFIQVLLDNLLFPQSNIVWICLNITNYLKLKIPSSYKPRMKLKFKQLDFFVEIIVKAIRCRFINLPTNTSRPSPFDHNHPSFLANTWIIYLKSTDQIILPIY